MNNPSFRRFFLGLSLLCLSWLFFCLWVDQIRWNSWEIGIDTAAWGQLVHQGNQGKGWIYTCYPDVPDRTDSRSIMSAHSFWLTPLVGLLYRIWSHPLVLFASVHIAHAGGAFLIGLLVWRLGKEDLWLALGAAFVFLLFPPHALAQTRYDFAFRHWTLFLIPLTGIMTLSEHQFRPLLPLFLLAAAEENLSLVAGFICFGLAWNWPDHRRWFAGWGLLFCAYTIFAIKIGIPMYLEKGFQLHFTGRYSHLGQGAGAVIGALFTSANAQYALELLAPLAFIPLWRPSIWLIAAIPYALQNLLSVMGDTRLIGHHYTTPLAVILFMAAVTSLCSMSGVLRTRLLTGLIVVNLLLAFTWYPSLAWLTDGPDPRSQELAGSLAPLTTLIPREGTLSAPPAVAARFWSKSGLWYFPQGMDIADFIVVPRFLPGYPSLTQEDLRNALTRLSTQPGLKRVLENPDIIVFSRQTVPKP